MEAELKESGKRQRRDQTKVVPTQPTTIQSLLQFLAIVVRGGLLDLRLDLRNTRLDVSQELKAFA